MHEHAYRKLNVKYDDASNVSSKKGRRNRKAYLKDTQRK